ncbi:MAG: response regulator [Pseudomonadota bacterium]
MSTSTAPSPTPRRPRGAPRPGGSGRLRAQNASARGGVLRVLLDRIRSGRAVLPASYRGAAEPAVLSTLSGRILDRNPAIRAAGGDALFVGDVLGLLADCDAALIYRLSRSAARLGFALEQVRARQTEQLVFIAVSNLDDDRLLWRLLTLDRLADAVLPSQSDHFEAAPFAYLRLPRNGFARSNTRFRELFGSDRTALLARICNADGAIVPGRHRLPAADGRERLVRVFVPGDRAAKAALREVFIFDLTREEAREGGAVGDLDDLPAAVMQLTPDGSILWMNNAARRALGPAAEPGGNLASAVESRGRPLTALFEEARGAPGTGRIDMVYGLGGGAERALQISLMPSRGDGGQTLLAVLHDASELQTLQDKYAQSQKMEAVGKLAGGVAHDFNNLITAINGHCDLLMLGKDATQPEYSDLMQIRQNANRAAALVRQLLAFSRKQTLNPTVLNVPDVISDTMYLLDRLIGDRVRLELDPEPEGQIGAVRADHRHLEQALMNLVVNARDAMPNGGAVTISTRRRRFRSDHERQGSVIPAGDYVELAVADEGMGIEDGVIDKVFDPFFTTKAQGEGTGLGLSTVYGIVKQSGGFVFAENRPEGGACFRMMFPRLESPVAQEAKPDTVRAPDLTGQGSILLVEDEAAVRSFAARALRLRGYDVEMTEEAEEALQLLEDETRHFDLIVSDVMMPGMDGPAFVAEARKMRPDLSVLFVSGYAEEAFRRDIENPEYAFLAKPFSLAELTAKVKEVLSGQD